ncbi:MAG: hypothetical protein WCR30_03605 [Clostridia bacterium]
MRFSVEEYGFSKVEVEDALNKIENQMKEQKNRIFSLKNENEKLINEIEILRKEKLNSYASAIEKLKEIENSTDKILHLKFSQMDTLLKDWKKLISGLFEKYPFIKNIGSFADSIEDFQDSINKFIAENNQKRRITNPIKTPNDSMRALLEKMSNNILYEETPKVVKIERVNIAEDDIANEKNSQIKPITELELNENDKYDTLMEKFLQADSSDNLEILEKHLIASNKPLVKESGFDLKEAVNPKDDLEEIMKAFDFFPEINKSSK